MPMNADSHLIVGDTRRPLLVYVPGWMAGYSAAEAFVRPLCEHYHCFVPALPGSWGMPWHAIGPSLAAYARWIATEIDARWPTSTYVLLGNSMGGMIAQELALLMPDRVRALVLLATTASFQDPERPLSAEIWQRFLAYRTMSSPLEFTLSVLPYLVTPEEVPGYAAIYRSMEPFPFPAREALDERYEAMRAHDTRARLPALTCPTLVLHGAQDRLIPATHGEHLASCLPAARLHCVPNAAHTLGVPGIEAVQSFLSGR